MVAYQKSLIFKINSLLFLQTFQDNTPKNQYFCKNHYNKIPVIPCNYHIQYRQMLQLRQIKILKNSHCANFF